MIEHVDEPEDPGGSRPSLSAGGVSIVDEQTVPVDSRALGRLAERLLEMLDVPDGAHLSILLVDEARIATLKAQALGVHAATDVLSFPMDDPNDPSPGPLVLGDIVICPRVALRQARALGHDLPEELARLLVHGLLHILGRSHDDAATERAMAAEERTLLSGAGAAR